jgi:serine/threonine protein phosphatase PrpC
MFVSVVLLATLLAGGYALFLWVKQSRGASTVERPKARSLGSARDQLIKPVELSASAKRAEDPFAPGAGALQTPQARTSRTTAAQGSLALGAAPSRERAETVPEVSVVSPQARKARRRDPTMQISADELSGMLIEDEGTTLDANAIASRVARRKVSLTCEVDIGSELTQPHIEHDTDLSGPISPIMVVAAGNTHVGKKRKHNEDAMAILDQHSVYVIADGMGGYAAGEVASQMTVDIIRNAFDTKNFGGDPILGLPPLGDELVRAIQSSNAAVLHESRNNAERAGMGTTVVSVRFVPGRRRAYIAHVGDSRLYRMRNDELVQLTTDHTLGQQGVQGAAAHKLSRAIGVFDDVEVDLTIDEPQIGDVYLLCSDGLFKMLHETQIVEYLHQNPDPNVAAQVLVDEANVRGGKDNITVIVLCIVDARAALKRRPN